MLTAELAQEIRLLELSVRRRVEQGLVGTYASAFRGRGLEFHDVRAYEPGDDVRTIDWNVTARTGAPHIKRFVHERERTVTIVVDVSASGSFGSRTRLRGEAALEVVAAYALAAARSQDRVGLLAFSDRVERWSPPRRGQGHALRLLAELVDHHPAPRTDPLVALDALLLRRPRAQLIALVSDFMFPPLATDAGVAAMGGRLDRLARRNDVVLTHLVDPAEADPGRAGLVRAIDPETGVRRLVDLSSPSVRERLRAVAERRRRTLADLAARSGADLVEIDTTRSVVRPLVELFRRRAGRAPGDAA